MMAIRGLQLHNTVHIFIDENYKKIFYIRLMYELEPTGIEFLKLVFEEKTTRGYS